MTQELSAFDAVYKYGKNIHFDYRGHNRLGSGNIKKLSLTLSDLDRWLPLALLNIRDEESQQHILEVMSGEKEPGVQVVVDSMFITCADCGEHLSFMFDGKNMICTEECPYPNGVTYEIELNVPSGKMVVANDLRQEWEIAGHYNVNDSNGCKKTSEKYAEAGMAHAFVGNTCPGVYRVTPKSFVIGVKGKKNPVPRSRAVAGICTDLWWYSIVDHDDYAQRLGDPKKHDDVEIVKCEPGVYRFKHLYHAIDVDKYPQVYTEIEWVREPDPVKNYKEKFDNLNFTAGQIVADFFTEVCTSVEKTMHYAVDHILGVCGNGYDYHENGFLYINPDLEQDAPSIDIPILTGQYNWYPLAETSFVVRAAGVGKSYGWQKEGDDFVLNDSFVALAFNMLHCISKYGVKSSFESHDETTLMYAKKALRGLSEKYPNLTPQYVKDYFDGKS